MDRLIERSHMGLIYIYVMCLAVGGVAGVSTTVVWGGVGMPWCHCVAYSDQH